MGFAKKISRSVKRVGKKSARVLKTASRKAAPILNDVGIGMEIAGNLGEAAAAVAAFSGQEEVAVPLLGASEALKYGGKATQNASKGLDKVNKGDYAGAAIQIQKTAVQAKKDKNTYTKNQEKRTRKLKN